MFIITVSSTWYILFMQLIMSIEHFFEWRLDDKDSITLFAAFIVIVLNIFGALVREWASTALKLQIELLKLMFGCKKGGISDGDQDLLNGFPCDIHTV